MAPAVGELGPEGVLRHADDVQVLERCRRGPRCDQRVQVGDVAVVVGGLGGVEPELPAVAGPADAHEGRGAPAVAHLVGPLPLAQIAGGVHVDDQPALLEPQVEHVCADGGAREAVGAVAAEHVRGQQRLRRPVDPIGQVDPDRTVAVLGEARDLGPAAQRGERVAGEVGAQERLELRLVEHGGLGKAVPAPVGASRELGQHRHVGPDEPQTVAGPRHRGELVAHAQSGQDAVDLVVEVHGPGLRVDRLPPVEDQALDPVTGEQCRGRQPGRAGADDHDGGAGDVPGVHGLTPSRTMR